jgi:hypothetical protein
MAVTKHKDADWKYYLGEIVQSGGKISESEMLEFSGFLLKRDMQHPIMGDSHFRSMIMARSIELAERMSAYFIAESPDTSFDLLQHMKVLTIDYYKDQILKLIDVAMQIKKLNQEDGA